MKVLVTGATGFLGSHLCELLKAQGHEVRALVRRSSNTRHLESLGVELALASLEEGHGLEEAVTGVDAVVHGAAMVKAKRPEEFSHVNAGGTRRLLDATLKAAPNVQRFVLVSSLAAHGFGEGGAPRPVTAPSRPVTHYGRSKLEAEHIVLARKDTLPVTIVRPPAIYGPRDVEMLAVFKMVRGRVVTFVGSGQNRLSVIYGPDAAKALYHTLTKSHASGRVYHIEDGRVYCHEDLVGYVERAMGVKTVKFSLPVGVVSVAALGSELYGKLTDKAMMLTRDKVNELREHAVAPPSTEISEELGWRPEVQLEDGARLTADWYKQQGWL